MGLGLVNGTFLLWQVRGTTWIDAIDLWVTDHPIWSQVIGLVLVAVLARLLFYLTKRRLVDLLSRVVSRTKFTWDDTLHHHQVFERLAHLVPALVIFYGTEFVPALNPALAALIQRAAAGAMILVAMLSAGSFLSALNDIYQERPEAASRPIKGYLQVVKIVIYILGTIVILATLIDRSPFVFLGGVGALTAVVLLVFRDTILSLVASIQLTNNDMLRVGDWIEMAEFGADGDVIDIALHTVKVQNWDKTITTIPTHKLIDQPFKNWRGMSVAGGRRIKRALHIDVNTVRFLDESDLERFSRFYLLRDYIAAKKVELAEYNEQRVADSDVVANARRLTNLGTFRAYIVKYLRDHPKIHQGMTLMVRQLQPAEKGLPLQIYAFSNDTDWVRYEGLQSDIFDHLVAIAPEFGLRVFQVPSGQDLSDLGGGDALAAAATTSG